VGFHVRRQDAPGEAGISKRFQDEGLSPHRWGNGPGDTYGWHQHPYHKVLYCVRGSIAFHARDGEDVELGPGDRLDIEPGTEHAATVGPEGVECMEAAAEGARR
jgi:quercetin dioxygenase-like cupin family protein